MQTTWFGRRKLEDIVATQKNVENSSIFAAVLYSVTLVTRLSMWDACAEIGPSFDAGDCDGRPQNEEDSDMLKTIIIFSCLWRRHKDYTSSLMIRYEYKQYKELRKKFFLIFLHR